jgi:hypothetical protein
MAISITYRGGVIVYLNGKEVARGHMPDGEVGPQTLAKGYPLEAYVSPEGNLLRHGWREPETYADRFRLRVRRLTDVSLPVGLLRHGMNILAVEVHRAVLPEVVVKARAQRSEWASAGVIDLRLSAQSNGAVLPNLARPKGLQVWNCDLLADVYDQDYGDPHERIRPIALVGARNGTFSGKVLVSADGPIKGLRARATDLRPKNGRGRIPMSEINLRYAKVGYAVERRAQYRYPGLTNVRRFDGLVVEPPTEVSVFDRTPERQRGALPTTHVFGAVQPIWVTVSVPRTAEPGHYRGSLAISVDEAEPVSVPLELTVTGWVVPDPADFVSHVGLYQSPESVALFHRVPLWSDEHFRLLGRSFEQLARIGNKLVIVPLVCRTDEGGSQSMVRWIKGADGQFTYDFSIMERYLDLAERHMGKPKFVVVKVWEVYGYLRKKRPLWTGKPLVSRLDQETGEVHEMEGPRYDSPESTAFWKPVLEAVQGRLKKRGLLEAMLLGQGRDTSPETATMTLFQKILPDVKWMRSAHSYMTTLRAERGSVPIGLLEHVWNASWGREKIPDPSVKRLHGWRGPFLAVTFPRWPGGTVTVPRLTAPLSVYRTFTESTILAGQHGFGRVGADFWPVRKGRYGRTVSIAGRFAIAYAAPGPVSISCPAVLAPGPAGAQSTARFEMLIENVQACEARIFVERALLEARDRLGESLATRCQKILDERTRYIRWAYVADGATWLWYPASGWQARIQALFAAAADVAAALER